MQLTVKQELTFCCQLRAEPSMSRAEKDRLVEEVIRSLGLTASRHSIIGSTEVRGISGGQRKRVNVGMVSTSASPGGLGQVQFGMQTCLTILLDRDMAGADQQAAGALPGRADEWAGLDDS